MTQLWASGQPINVAADDDGIPIEFTWQEHCYTVGRIVQRWEVDVEWWRTEGRVWREYLALITDDNLFCVIYYDRLHAQWLLSRLYD